MTSPRRLLLLGAVAAALLTGCGGEGKPDTAAETGKAQEPPPEPFLQVDLPGKGTPEDAGFLLAHRNGYFPQARAHVWFVSPSHSARTPMYVEQELVDAAMIREPQLILERERGRPLVAFGSLVAHPTTAMIWLEGSGIDSIADLKGKTIAIPGIRFQKFFLESVLERAGLTLADVKLKSVSYYPESELIQGRADAVFGGSMNTEARLLEAHGLDPVVTPVTDLGVPDYEELVLVARRDRYEEDPELFQRLLKGTVRGGAAVAGQPGAATKAIVRQREGEVPAGATRAGVVEMAPLFSRTGSVDRAKLRHLIDWMHEEGMIERKIPLSDVLAGP